MYQIQKSCHYQVTMPDDLLTSDLSAPNQRSDLSPLSDSLREAGVMDSLARLIIRVLNRTMEHISSPVTSDTRKVNSQCLVHQLGSRTSQILALIDWLCCQSKVLIR